MTVFVDPSAFLAIVDRDEANHPVARRVWEQLVSEDTLLICTNYVLLETFALLQSRFGMAHVQAFQENAVPVLHIERVDETLHQAGMAALLTANRRRLSPIYP